MRKIVSDGGEPRQGNLRLLFRLFKSVARQVRIRLNNLKTSLTFPCRGLNPIIDSINLFPEYFLLFSSPEPKAPGELIV